MHIHSQRNSGIQEEGGRSDFADSFVGGLVQPNPHPSLPQASPSPRQRHLFPLQLSVLIKRYQREVEALEKRSKFSEKSYLDVYRLLRDRPDPYLPLKVTRAHAWCH